MAKIARPVRADLTDAAHKNRDRLAAGVLSRVPTLGGTNGVPPHVKALARTILRRSRGVLVSSTMALSAAIVALRESGDFGRDSVELRLLEAVLRYSEDQQVPPKVVMRALADDDGASGEGKFD